MGRADTVDLSARVDALTARVAALEAALSAAVAREAERLRLARESAGVAGDRAAPPRGGAGSARGGAEGGEGSREAPAGAAGAVADVRWVGDAVRGGEALAPVAAVTWSAIGPVVVAAEARVVTEGALVVVALPWRADDGDDDGAAVAAAALARWCALRGARLRGMRRG